MLPTGNKSLAVLLGEMETDKGTVDGTVMSWNNEAMLRQKEEFVAPAAGQASVHKRLSETHRLDILGGAVGKNLAAKEGVTVLISGMGRCHMLRSN